MDNDIVIHPSRQKGEKKIPRKGVFFINPQDFSQVVKVVKGLEYERKFLFNSNLYVNNSKGTFFAGPGIGAPMAAMILEKLIALGCEEIIVFGWCGAINTVSKVGEVVLVDKTVSGEGTSKYYSDSIVGTSSASLNSKIISALNTEEIDYKYGTVWSTDAPYRESRKHLLLLKKEYNIEYIDMEIAALQAVANFRSIDLSGLFIVSDVIDPERWKPGFMTSEFKMKKHATIDWLLSSDFY